MSGEYQAYLVRLERSGVQADWRVYVENAETGDVWHFATEWELIHFLLEILLSFPGKPDSSALESIQQGTTPHDK